MHLPGTASDFAGQGLQLQQAGARRNERWRLTGPGIGKPDPKTGLIVSIAPGGPAHGSLIAIQLGKTGQPAPDR